jgi:hypothetical protein
MNDPMIVRISRTVFLPRLDLCETRPKRPSRGGAIVRIPFLTCPYVTYR